MMQGPERVDGVRALQNPSTAPVSLGTNAQQIRRMSYLLLRADGASRAIDVMKFDDESDRQTPHG